MNPSTLREPTESYEKALESAQLDHAADSAPDERLDASDR